MKPSATAPTTLALLLVVLTLTRCAASEPTRARETPTAAPTANPTATTDPLMLLRTLTAQTAVPTSQVTSAATPTSTPLLPAPAENVVAFTPTPIPLATNTASPATTKSNITKIGFMSDRDYLNVSPVNGERPKEVYVMDADGRNQTRVTLGQGWGKGLIVTRLLWHPDGRRLFLNESGYDNFIIDASTRRVVGKREWGVYPSFSPDGMMVAYFRTEPRLPSPGTFGFGRIFSLNLASLGEQRLTRSETVEIKDWMPAWSPDGKFIAYSHDMPNTKDPEDGLFIMHADGTNARRLNNRFVRALAWSPDDRKIAFESGFDRNTWPYGSMDIWIIDIDSGQETNLTKSEKVWDAEPSWSPDSKQIVFESMPSNFSQPSQIWVMNADGTGLRQLTTVGSNAKPAWVR